MMSIKKFAKLVETDETALYRNIKLLKGIRRNSRTRQV